MIDNHVLIPVSSCGATGSGCVYGVVYGFGRGGEVRIGVRVEGVVIVMRGGGCRRLISPPRQSKCIGY